MSIEPSPNGLGLVEAQVMVSLLDLGATKEYGVKTRRLLDYVADRGIAPDLAHHAVIGLVQPWRLPIQLIEPHGNFGSIAGDPPAEPRYTDVWLTPLGAQVALAETGEAMPLPVGLLIGDWHFGGERPCFDPTRFVAAMTRLIREPATTAGELHDMLGPPVSGSGATVEVDVERLLSGLRVSVVESAVIQVVSPNLVVVTDPPLDSGLYWALEHIGHANNDDVIQLIDNSRNDSIRWEFTLRPEVDAQSFAAELSKTWPLRIERPAALGTSWRSLATKWLSAVDDHAALTEHLALLAPEPPLG